MSPVDRQGGKARARFRYEVVSSNGHGVHSREIKTLAEAHRVAAAVAERAPILGPYEIQQVRTRGSGRRYWMRRGSKWVLWSSAEDMEVRRPDWRWPDV